MTIPTTALIWTFRNSFTASTLAQHRIEKKRSGCENSSEVTHPHNELIEYFAWPFGYDAEGSGDDDLWVYSVAKV